MGCTSTRREFAVAAAAAAAVAAAAAPVAAAAAAAVLLLLLLLLLLRCVSLTAMACWIRESMRSPNGPVTPLAYRAFSFSEAFKQTKQQQNQ